MTVTLSPSLSERFPARAVVWRLRTRSLSLGRRPLVMGIVNVTPDSFSDGGDFFDPAAAIDHALCLAAEGADLLDIGGESTRPYSEPVAVEEELRRVEPVVRAVSRQTDVPVSIDTSKARVAEVALDAGAEMVNDITGLTSDPNMTRVVSEASAGVCAMHMQGTPQTMQDEPSYRDVVEDVYEYLRMRRDALESAGIPREQIALDPGIGFGKTQAHNLSLLSHAGRFHELGCPLLFGPSRKGFLSKVLGDKQGDRTAATIGVALALAAGGVQIVRVHDVRPVREALLLFEAVGGAS